MTNIPQEARALHRFLRELYGYGIAKYEIVGERAIEKAINSAVERETKTLSKRIAHADDLARDYAVSDAKVFGQAMKSIRKALDAEE